MSVLRCNKCGYLEELEREAIGSTRTCPKCATPTAIHDTAQFIGKVLQQFFAMKSELVRLRGAPSADGPSARSTGGAESFDIHNSDVLTSELQHGPIRDWFERRQVQVRINAKAVDTTGFFDEVAAAIGKDYEVLKEVVERIRYAQGKGYSSAKIFLDRKTPEQARLITEFCRRLHDYSFVARCFQLKEENQLRLVLQTAPAIEDFFRGGWLEWHVFMAMLALVRRHQRRYSCARNLQLTFPNGENYELDVFFLLDGDKPVCVECKTGEFRDDIERCLTLKKRLGMRRENFILCALGLGAEQAQGLSSMYELGFVGEQALAECLENVLATGADWAAKTR